MPFGKFRQINVIGLKIIMRGVGANIIIARPVNVGDFKKNMECAIFNPAFIGFEETSSYWSVQF